MMEKVPKYLSIKVQMFFDRQYIKQHIVLWTHSKTLSYLHNLCPNVVPIDGGCPTCWWNESFSRQKKSQ